MLLPVLGYAALFAANLAALYLLVGFGGYVSDRSGHPVAGFFCAALAAVLIFGVEIAALGPSQLRCGTVGYPDACSGGTVADGWDSR